MMFQFNENINIAFSILFISSIGPKNANSCDVELRTNESFVRFKKLHYFMLVGHITIKVILFLIFQTQSLVICFRSSRFIQANHGFPKKASRVFRRRRNVRPGGRGKLFSLNTLYKSYPSGLPRRWQALRFKCDYSSTPNNHFHTGSKRIFTSFILRTSS